MKTAVIGLLAETSVHPGGGRSLGVVDLPVAREAATEYPVLVGSALKGALRDRTGTQQGKELATRWFGAQDNAGELLVSDGRLLLLPVRSLTGASQWVTCPQLVERYRRDLVRAGWVGTALPDWLPAPDSDQALATEPGESGELFLEERQFRVGQLDRGFATALGRLVPHPEVRERLARRLVVVDDHDFGWFARYGLPITARNRLDDAKQSKNLWYEETLPPDTVLYTLVTDRRDDALAKLREIFPEQDRYLQAGGNETVGQGWFAVGFPDDEAVSA